MSKSIYFEVTNIINPAQNIKNKEGNAAASNRSCEAYIYAWVAKVSKLNGLKINVIGNSFIISSEIKIEINIKITLIVFLFI